MRKGKKLPEKKEGGRFRNVVARGSLRPREGREVSKKVGGKGRCFSYLTPRCLRFSERLKREGGKSHHCCVSHIIRLSVLQGELSMKPARIQKQAA